MNDLYIEDDNNNRLYYRFTPSALISNFVPLVVIFDEDNSHNDMNFEYKMWNVLTPIGDFKEIDLICRLIEDLMDEYGCEEHTYIYGSFGCSDEARLFGRSTSAHTVYIEKSKVDFDKKVKSIKGVLDDLEKMISKL